MRFNPRIIHDEDETAGIFANDLDERAFEDSLPDGFAELAAQLGEDADMLDQRYPASGSTTEPIATSQTSHEPSSGKQSSGKQRLPRTVAWLASATAVASVMLAGFLTVQLYRGVKPSQAPVAKSPAPVAEHTAANVVPSSVTTPEPESRPAPINRVAFAPGKRRTPAPSSAIRTLPDAPAEAPGFLKDVSAPELEALYDLWEQDGPSEMKISI